MENPIQLEKINEKDEDSSSDVSPSTGTSLHSSSDVSPSTGSTLQQNGTMYNLFAAKKTAAQGMMDVALLTSNANQLRYLIEFSERSVTYHCLFVLIILSLILQLIVGIMLIMKGRSDIRRRSTSSGEKLEKSEYDIHLSQCTSVGVFLFTIVNIFIAAFSINVSSRTLQPDSTVQG